MEYKKLGQSELKVSVISMGCWAISGDSTWGLRKKVRPLLLSMRH